MPGGGAAKGERVSAIERDLLWENEVQANHVLARFMLMSFVAGLVAAVLVMVRAHEEAILPWWPHLLVIIEALLLAGPILCWRFGAERAWLKTAMMLLLVVVCGIVNVLLATAAALVTCAPVVLSIRYFSRSYTLRVAVASFAMFLCTTVLGAYLPPFDLNCVVLPAGTLVGLSSAAWLGSVVEGMTLDTSLMVENTLLYSCLPYGVVFIVVASACVSIAGRGSDLVARERDLVQQSAAIDAELNLAARIQADALPSTFPAFPGRADFDVYALMEPAREVAGDFYDFFLVDDDHLCLVIADVSEKGVPAALFMMGCKAMIADRAMMGHSPARILADVNHAVCARDQEAMFVTVWLGILDLRTGRLVASNAGHEYPFVRHPGASFELLEDDHDSFVGYLDGIEYAEYELVLEPGSSLFVYTDGLPEATDASRNMFGMDRLARALDVEAGATPDETIAAVDRQVKVFVGEAERFDDLTMMCVSYSGTRT